MDNYLYEIIDDYKHADSEKEREEIFNLFSSSIWSSENKRRIYPKTIRFTVRKDLSTTAVGQIFLIWSEIEYMGYQSMTRDTCWCSLIRQKINNLYTRYFDREVILKRDYMDLLGTPKRLYYQWAAGAEMNPDELTLLIDDAIGEAQRLKLTYQKQKMELSWSEYKTVMEEFLHKILNNCMLIDDYEDKTRLYSLYDFINEDNFYIRYFCQYLEQEMKQWQKKYYGVRNHKPCTRCRSCGKLIEKTNNRILYCRECATEINRKKTRENRKNKRAV